MCTCQVSFDPRAPHTDVVFEFVFELKQIRAGEDSICMIPRDGQQLFFVESFRRDHADGEDDNVPLG